jgi:beta-galactosidase
MNQIFKCLLTVAALAAPLSGHAKDVTSLNESWNFMQTTIVPWGTPPYTRVPKGNAVVNIPHTWNEKDFMSDKGYFRGDGTYQKDLMIPESDRRKRIFIHFEGVSQIATIFCNWEMVGQHIGAFNGFTVEITDQVKYGEKNTIAVVCDNNRRLDIGPIGGDFNTYGGIYRDVWLEKSDESACISPLFYGSNGMLVKQMDVNKNRASLQAEIHLTTKTDYQGCSVEFSVIDANGKIVASEMTPNIYNDKCLINLAVDHPRLWQGTTDPYLYKVVAVLKRNGREIDRVEDKTGFRSFYVDSEKGFFLNGQHLKLHGVNRHQEWAGIATALKKENHETDMNLIEDMGANAMRMAHYPQAQYMLSEADRRGFVVWEEIPLVTHYVPSVSFDNNLREDLREMIYQNYNHPSICFWGLFNEVGNGHNRIVAEMNDMVHRIDPSRLSTSGTCFDGDFNFITDVLGWNRYFGWSKGKTADLGPFLDKWHADHPYTKTGLSEYGAGSGLHQHVAKANTDGGHEKTSSRFHPMENQTAIHHDDYQAIAKRDFVWGSFVWNMFDFSSAHRREGEVNCMNDKGLVSYDRKTKKDVFYFYRANWNKKSPTTYLCSKGYIDRKEDVTDIVGFVSDGDATLFINGKKIGTQKADDVHTVIWKALKLHKGQNIVELKSKNGSDKAVWEVK